MDQTADTDRMERFERSVATLEAAVSALGLLVDNLADRLNIDDRTAGSPRRKWLLTINEVCEVIGCTRNTIYTLFRRGELRKFRDGGKMTRIPRADVEAYIKRHTEQARKNAPKNHCPAGQSV